MDPVQLTSILPGPITADSTAGDAADDRASAVANFDSFLTLLTAQLRNQDPMAPLESTEFVAQLATFSAVEQQIGTNERLDTLTSQSLAGDIAAFANWIGKDVSLQDGRFRANGEEVSFKVPNVAGADQIRATVNADDGAQIAQFNVAAGSDELGTWDGLDQNGRAVTGEDVRISLEYLEQGGTLTTLAAEVPRRVTGLRGTPAGVVLDLADGGEAGPEDVARITTAD